MLLFVQYLTLILLNKQINIIRLIISSLAGSIIYILSLYIDNYGYALISLLPFINTIILNSFCHVKDYLTSVFIFIALYFAIIGSSVFIAYLINIKSVNIIYFLGYIPYYISISCIVITFLIIYIKKELLKINLINENILKAEILNENFSCRINAYYDSGNMIYAKNGEMVVIVNENLYNELMPATNVNITVATITEEKCIPATPVLLKIYFQDGMNKIYKVMAGKGKIESHRYNIILHKDMR